MIVKYYIRQQNECKTVIDSIHDAYAGPAEDRAIDAGEELKNIRMMDNETANEHHTISCARGIAVKCATAGLNLSKESR